MTLEAWIVIVLLILWATGYLAFPSIGALIHILLIFVVLAAGVALYKAIRRLP